MQPPTDDVGSKTRPCQKCGKKFVQRKTEKKCSNCRKPVEERTETTEQAIDLMVEESIQKIQDAVNEVIHE